MQVAIQTLEEIRQGRRSLPILVDGKKEPQTPKNFLEQAKQQPCKTRHFAFTRQEMELQLPQLYANYGAGAFCRTDSWVLDEGRGYEWIVTLDLSFDKDTWIDFCFDPVTEGLHQIELYLPAQKAVACVLNLLETIDPSLTDADRTKLRETLPAYPMGESRYLEEILKKKHYSVYAGSEDDNLSVIIE